jgi:HEPN domain-containing protein
MAKPSLHTDYVQAALERLEESRVLIETGNYPGAIYFSGLAAESMIKGFIAAKSEKIKGHNLATLSQTANFSRRLKPNVRFTVDAAITEASLMWRNLYRYSSASDLDRMGKQNNVRFESEGTLIRYSQMPPGERLRLWAERMYNLSAVIVSEGQIIWQSQQR